ncbi:hypothetical protein TUBRATIS_29720 [Tubulinosema ratisbonensis]|uniref:Ferritin n=1 Tax=Tubulinosema ratisbonensis TaxID=291195 RepID=A0A437AHP1_9MICR|nr:hypothetical protein TUBRATIS_29720 [Tubulinosema ratisbonensis]
MGDWKDKASELLSKQLNNEYTAFYFYTSCSSYFDKKNVELPGLKKFFRKMAEEELEHAQGIINFMNARGMTVSFLQVKDFKTNYESVVDVLVKSIDFEEKVLKDLSLIYKEAEESNDYTTTTFLDPYVIEQVESIKELNSLKVNAERCMDPLGIYLFDQQFLAKRRKK